MSNTKNEQFWQLLRGLRTTKYPNWFGVDYWTYRLEHGGHIVKVEPVYANDGPKIEAVQLTWPCGKVEQLSQPAQLAALVG